MKRKIRLTESEFHRLIKRLVIETQEEMAAQKEMEEGWLGDMGRGIRKFATGHESSESRLNAKRKLEDELDKLTSMVQENPEAFYLSKKWDSISNRYRNRMEENNYRGFFTIDGLRLDDPNLQEHMEEVINDGDSEMVIKYIEGLTKAQEIGSGAGSATRSYQSKAQSNESLRRRNRLR
jgi:hypothetical protein